MDEKFYRIFNDLYCPACYSCNLRDVGRNLAGEQIIKCNDCGAILLKKDYYSEYEVSQTTAQKRDEYERKNI